MHTLDAADWSDVALGPAPGRRPVAADCLLVLASADFDPSLEGGLPGLVRGLAERLPVYLAIPDLDDEEARLESTDDPRIRRMRVSRAFGVRQGAEVNRLLCSEHRIRPVVLTDELAWGPYVASRFSASTILCLSDAACVALATPEAVEVGWNLRRIVARADLVLAPSQAVLAHLEAAHGLAAGRVMALRRHPGQTPAIPPKKRIKKDELLAHAYRRAALARYGEPDVSLDWASAFPPDGETHGQLDTLFDRLGQPRSSDGRLNVLICYDDTQTHIATLREYLESYRMYSRHHVQYASACTGAAAPIDLGVFDVVVMHYSVRVSLPDYVSPSFVRALQSYGGYKVLYMQDDYETTEQARRWIAALGIHSVYTCVLREHHDEVFPRDRFPAVEFIRTLTGYVPLEFDQARERAPLSARKTLIGYRGRALPYWYGNLGQEKLEIGVRMREICEARGLPVDIEWDDSKRIYGDDWYRFHERVRAVLGSESGCNVFDDDGAIRDAIREALERKPDLTYAEAFERYIKPREGQIKAAQISPRVFEAIALGAALVMFEGSYDNIVKPDVHYISLKKDFSNVDEVLAKLQDDAFVERLTQRAYEDIVLSGRWSYRRMVADFDAYLTSNVGRGGGLEPVTSVVGYRDPRSGTIHADHAAFSRGYPAEQVLSWFRDEYEKYPAGWRSFHYDGPPPGVEAPPAEKREKWIMRVPGVRLFDRCIGKPFHQFWEYHRKRLFAPHELEDEA